MNQKGLPQETFRGAINAKNDSSPIDTQVLKPKPTPLRTHVHTAKAVDKERLTLLLSSAHRRSTTPVYCLNKKQNRKHRTKLFSSGGGATIKLWRASRCYLKSASLLPFGATQIRKLLRSPDWSRTTRSDLDLLHSLQCRTCYLRKGKWVRIGRRSPRRVTHKRVVNNE